jgi:hypothetical protein
VTPAAEDVPILPALWRIETALHGLAGSLRAHHEAVQTLMLACDAPPEVADTLQAAIGQEIDFLHALAADLQRIRHRLSRVLP